MHAILPHINVDEVIQTGPLSIDTWVYKLLWTCFSIGIIAFSIAFFTYPKDLLWGAYYTNLLFWMGLAAGGVIISAIVQIVRARWVAPFRRIAEANVMFLPFAYVLLLSTWAGKEYLFPWAREPMPGREVWMQPGFVYARFAILFGILFFLMIRYVLISVKGDMGIVRDKAVNKEQWQSWEHDILACGWKGESSIPELQNKLSFSAPALILAYAVIYSLFAFEMVMAMDKVWYSNMYGGFTFVGNIYMGWASVALMGIFFATKSPAYRKVLSKHQLWDIGKLTFGFSMLWGYMFLSQLLPQWYGNLPEETQWMILRTRDLPWRPFGFMVLSMCFVFPFVLLAGEYLKKNPYTLSIACLIVLCGVWAEKYITVMPQLSPAAIPFGWLEPCLTAGFFGLYGLCILAFLTRVPFIAVSHPLTRGINKW